MARTFDVPGSTDASVAILVGSTTIQYPHFGIGGFGLYKRAYTYVINRDDWYLTGLNTVSPYDSGMWLIEETVPTDIGGGLVQWQRWYGTTPAIYSTYSYEAVTFPGFYDSYDTDTNFRPPYTLIVPVEVHHEFLKTNDPVTDFVIDDDEQKELYMNARGEYVDYVDDSTTVQPVGSSRTYTEYTDMVTAGDLIYVREPIGRRCYGVGNIWERVSFRTPAL